MASLLGWLHSFWVRLSYHLVNQIIHLFKLIHLTGHLYSGNCVYTKLDRLIVCHHEQRHPLKPIHLIRCLYSGNHAYTELDRLTVCHLGWLCYSIQVNLFHTSLQRTNLLLGELIKKSSLWEKKSVTSHRNIVFKGNKWKSRYLNWNKTWDLLHSTFVDSSSLHTFQLIRVVPEYLDHAKWTSQFGDNLFPIW